MRKLFIEFVIPEEEDFLDLLDCSDDTDNHLPVLPFFLEPTRFLLEHYYDVNLVGGVVRCE